MLRFMYGGFAQIPEAKPEESVLSAFGRPEIPQDFRPNPFQTR